MNDHWPSYQAAIRRTFEVMVTEVGLSAEKAERLAHQGRCNRGAILLALSSQVDDQLKPAAVELAAAIEMLHRASVIRDDVEDADYVRRGSPTELVIAGAPAALAVSDVLLFVGLTTIQRLHPDRIGATLALLRSMSQGQYFDICGPAGDIAEYTFKIAELKTGSLLSLSFLLGAVDSGRTDSDAELLASIGLELGTAFQLANDVKNVTHDEGRGKATGSDLVAGRHSAMYLLLRPWMTAENTPTPAQVAEAAAVVMTEVKSRLQKTRMLASTLEQPLHPELADLVFDEDRALAFVGDQQASEAFE